MAESTAFICKFNLNGAIFEIFWILYYDFFYMILLNYGFLSTSVIQGRIERSFSKCKLIQLDSVSEVFHFLKLMMPAL